MLCLYQGICSYQGQEMGANCAYIKGYVLIKSSGLNKENCAYNKGCVLIRGSTIRAQLCL